MAEIEYRFPLDGGYVNYGFHAGVHEGFDMIMESGPDIGQPIHSPSTGFVMGKGFGSPGLMDYNYGFWVELKMADGIYVFIAHMMAESPLTVGSKVTIGQQVGQLGQSGDVTGPHVHTGFMTRSLDKATSLDGVNYTDRRLNAQPAGGGGKPVPVHKKRSKDMLFYYIAKGASTGANLFILNGPNYHKEFTAGQPTANEISVQCGGPAISITRAFADTLKDSAFPNGVPASVHVQTVMEDDEAASS